MKTNRILLGLFLLLLTVTSHITIAGAQTLLQSGYFPRTFNNQPVDVPEVYWDNPGTLGGPFRFCVYRHKSQLQSTQRLSADFNGDGVLDSNGVFQTYTPPDQDNENPGIDAFSLDSSYATNNYAHIGSGEMTGVLEYFGIRNTSCQNSPSLPLTAATTTVARAIPNIHILQAQQQPTAHGIAISLTLEKFIDYQNVILWVKSPDQNPVALHNAFQEPIPPARGVTVVTFTIGSGEGELALPPGTGYQFGVSGLMAGGNAGNPLAFTGYPGSGSMSSRLTLAPNFHVDVSEPTETPITPPQNLQIIVDPPSTLILAWHNADNYDLVRIYQNDQQIAEVPASGPSTFTFPNMPFGQTATFGLAGVADNGERVSEISTIALTEPLLPAPPERVEVGSPKPEGAIFKIDPPRNADAYIDYNAIIAYELAITNRGTGEEIWRIINRSTYEEFTTNDITKVFVPLPDGEYSAAIRTLTQLEGSESEMVFSPFLEVEETVRVIPPGEWIPPVLNPTPIATYPAQVEAQQMTVDGDPYRVRFTVLNPQHFLQGYVEIQNNARQWIATLNPQNNFQATVHISDLGNLKYWVRGVSGLGWILSQDLFFTVQLPRPEIWYWNHENEVHLKILTAFPENSLARGFEVTWRSDGANVNELVQTTTLLDASSVAAGGFAYHTFALPTDFSRHGQQLVQVRANALGVEQGPQTPYPREVFSPANRKQFRVGPVFGDVDDDGDVDPEDLERYLVWIHTGSLEDRPACLENVNGNQNAYLAIPIFGANPAQYFPESLRCDPSVRHEGKSDLSVLINLIEQNHLLAEQGLPLSYLRGKPYGYHSPAPSPESPCYYDRYANPERPVFNPLQRFYPEADASCHHGPYENESEAHAFELNSTQQP